MCFRAPARLYSHDRVRACSGKPAFHRKCEPRALRAILKPVGAPARVLRPEHMRSKRSIAVVMRWRFACAPALRRCFGVLLAVMLFLASAGLTVVVPRPSDGTSAIAGSGGWFPCQGHACGCLSAEMCRARCCCHRPAAVLAPIAIAHRSSTGSESGSGLSRADAPATSHVKLVIQAATCGGGELSWVFKCECPVVRLERFALGLTVRPERPQPLNSGMGDQCTLAPDPPPPRAC